MRPAVGPSACLPHLYRPESATGPRPVAAGVLLRMRPGLSKRRGCSVRVPACRGVGAAPGASRSAGARNKAMLSGLPSRLPTRDLRTRRLRLRVPLRIRRRSPSMARFAVREAALARRWLTGIGRRMGSNEGCEAKPRSCCSLHDRLSLEAPRKAGWGLAADFEGQPGDQTRGPQGAPRTGAPTAGTGCAHRSARRVSCRTSTGPSPPQAPGLSWRGYCSGRGPVCRNETPQHASRLPSPLPTRLPSRLPTRLPSPLPTPQHASRLPTRDLRTRRLRLRVPLRIRRRSPSLARFAVRQAALARRSMTGIGRKMRSAQRYEAKMGFGRRTSCRSRHHRRSREAPRKAGRGLAAEFEGQPGDQAPGPQGGALRSARRVSCRTAAGPRPVVAGVLLRARPGLPKRNAPARFAPADARPADATAQAPRPAPHSPTLALHGSLRCPRGRAGAALADGHRPQDGIQRRMRSEAKIVLLTS